MRKVERYGSFPRTTFRVKVTFYFKRLNACFDPRVRFRNTCNIFTTLRVKFRTFDANQVSTIGLFEQKRERRSAFATFEYFVFQSVHKNKIVCFVDVDRFFQFL